MGFLLVEKAFSSVAGKRLHSLFLCLSKNHRKGAPSALTVAVFRHGTVTVGFLLVEKAFS